MKKTQKNSLFETVSFENEAARTDFYESELAKHKISKIATLVSIPLSFLTLLLIMAPAGSFAKTSPVMDAVAILLFGLSTACSVICLSFGGIFRYAGRVIKWSWLLIPVFPVDLFICMVNAVFSIVCIFIFPLIPCLIGLHQRKLNIKSAAISAIS